jgi:hypothetical protein
MILTITTAPTADAGAPTVESCGPMTATAH